MRLNDLNADFVSCIETKPRPNWSNRIISVFEGIKWPKITNDWPVNCVNILIRATYVCSCTNRFMGGFLSFLNYRQLSFWSMRLVLKVHLRFLSLMLVSKENVTKSNETIQISVFSSSHPHYAMFLNSLT